VKSPKLYIAWIMLFLVSLPLALDLVPPNGIYGLRIGPTLADPEVWRKANIFSGYVFIAAEVIGAAITRFSLNVVESWGSLLVVAVTLAALAISLVYVGILI
jgi:uncharacterized membrane protein